MSKKTKNISINVLSVFIILVCLLFAVVGETNAWFTAEHQNGIQIVVDVGVLKLKVYQNSIDDNNQISTIEMDNRTVYKLQLDYYDFLLDEEEHDKPLKPKTIINKLATYRGFF